MAYTWDDNGNLLSDGAATYTYDFANRLVAASDPTSLFTYAYDGSGNRYQQSTNGELITYTLDLAGGLSEVLYDGSTVYSYGLERLAQQVNGGGREYFLSDALGSVRQLTDAGGAVIYGQSFDPFGSPIAQVGTGGSAYGYAGQWTDLSGLQYLRARYYAPGQGRFLSRDPFAGFLSQPATLNPYVYAANNPVLMSDPSGEIAPLLALAGAGLLGGTMAMGFDILAQLYTIQPTSIDQIIHCMNWGEVGISFAAGTVAGLAGVVGFEAMTAIFGTGLLGMVAGGAFAGILSGQYDILTRLVLTGQISQAGSALLGPEDIIGTGLVGGGLAGIGYGISRVASRLLPGPSFKIPPQPSSPPSVSTIQQIQAILEGCAKRAAQSIGTGKGHSYGSKVHTAFAQEVLALGRSDLIPEISYRNNLFVRFGLKGSVRVDVVYGTINNPIAVFDLKTGSAFLSPKRIVQIQSHLPISNIPVIEIRP
ncbi:MAG TPA: RHS repeat-associated core domain-containing protein [Anaerolineaceae bacterium]|nr:RHS repeat-associated core domain-containing protein [Anaerolineaceae bacterium]